MFDNNQIPPEPGDIVRLQDFAVDRALSSYGGAAEVAQVVGHTLYSLMSQDEATAAIRTIHAKQVLPKASSWKFSDRFLSEALNLRDNYSAFVPKGVKHV